MTTALIGGGIVLALAIIAGLVAFGRRQRKAGEDGAVRDVQAGTIDAAKRANEGRFDATLKDYSDDPMDRSRRP